MNLQNQRLVMFGLSDMKLPFASVMTATTVEDSSGVLEFLLNVFSDLWTATTDSSLHNRCADGIEGLAPQALLPVLGRSLEELEELKHPGPNLGELARRVPLVARALSGERGSFDKVDLMIRKSLKARIVDLQELLSQVVESSPHELESFFELIMMQLSKPLLIDDQALVELQRLLEVFAIAGEQKCRVMPAAFGLLEQRLLEKACELYRKVLQLVAAVSLERVRIPLLKDLQRYRADLAEKIGRFKTCLNEAKETLRKESEKRVTSNVVLLKGLSSGEVLDSLKQRFSTSDREGVIAGLKQHLFAQLRALVSREFSLDEEVSSLDVVVRVGGPRLSRLLRDFVAAEVSGQSSVFRLIEKTGIEDCAAKVWRMAECLCDLGGFDNSHFGVTPLNLAVVVLPEAKDTADKAVNERVKAEFRWLSNGAGLVEFVEGSANALCVTRTVCGFPIGIESQNALLLASYARASGFHCPHLLLEDGGRGEAIPGYIELQEILEGGL